MTRVAAAGALAFCLGVPGLALADVSEETLRLLSAPDSIDTAIGKLEFKDGAPAAEPARAVYDAMDFANALAAYNNSFRAASAYAIRQGLLSAGAKDNEVVIFSEIEPAE